MKKKWFLSAYFVCLGVCGCTDASVSSCGSDDCGEHGYCVLNGEKRECICDDGYIENDALLCIPETGPCDDEQNCTNGKCLYASNGNAYCECSDGYEPDNEALTCVEKQGDNPGPVVDPGSNNGEEEKPKPTCDGVDCGRNGKCAIEEEMAICKCDSGYYADNVNMTCLSNTGACADNTKDLCQYGSCLYKDDDNKVPYCKCAAGFTADNDSLTCVIEKKDSDNNHMYDGYQKLAADYGKACKKHEDCSEGFCDSAIGNKCSRRCTSDNECQHDETYDYYCRRDGRCASKFFTTKWKPTESMTIDGKTYKNVVLFPFGSEECDYTIHYDEKTLHVDKCPEYDSKNLSKVAHILTFDHIGEDGLVTISVTGKINHWSCAYGKTPSKDLYAIHTNKNLVGALCTNLVEVNSFGPVTLAPFAFYKAGELQRVDGEEDIPDPTQMTNMAYMFMNSLKFAYGDINGWDTSNVTDMNHAFSMEKLDAFKDCNSSAGFNLDVGNWNTSKVTNLSFMFHCAKKFNRPIGDWDTTNVTDMRYLFDNAISFNQPIGDWNTSNNKTLDHTFASCQINQDIGKWDTSKVTSMASTFNNATKFSKDISGWNTSNVTNLDSTFRWALSFNNPIGKWDTSSVTSMNATFAKGIVNQDLSGWDVSKVKASSGTFEGSKFSNANLCKMYKVPAWKTILDNNGVKPTCD